MAKRLQAAGIEVKSTPKKFDSDWNVDHAKFLVVDGRQLLLGSGNLVRQGLGGNQAPEANNRDFWVEDTRGPAVSEAAKLFEADWTEQPTSAADFPTLVVTPDDASAELSALVRGAKQRVWVTNQSLSEPQVLADLLAAKARGVDVKVLLGAFQKNAKTPPANDKALQQLKAAGVEVQYYSASYLHAKTIVADDRAFIGSQNFTAAGMGRNRDLGAVYDDAALVQTMAAAFQRDWAAPGPQPVVG
jgi:phosphatidylserine/phosphatidylglycerophosphate/cardiolipin synthase-like enzyme